MMDAALKQAVRLPDSCKGLQLWPATHPHAVAYVLSSLILVTMRDHRPRFEWVEIWPVEMLGRCIFIGLAFSVEPCRQL